MKLEQFIQYARKFLVALAAALAILAVAMTDGLTPTEWVNVALAFLGALGVYATPNRLTDEQVKNDRLNDAN